MSAYKRNQKQTVINVFNNHAQDRIQHKQTQKQLYQIINRKNTQVAILNQINTRLGAELFKLQKKLGIDPDLIMKQLEDVNEISVAFHFQTQQLQYLDNLLTAYDENNLKQKKLIAHLYSSLEDSEKKTQNLIHDNEFLLQEMQEKCKQIMQIYSKGFPEENLTTAYTKLQRQTQVQLLQNMGEENQYLYRHFKEAEQKILDLQQELKGVKKNSDTHFSNYKEQSEDLKDAMIRVDDLTKIKQVLEKKIDQTTQQNIELQSLRQQLQSKVNKLEGQYKILRNQYQSQRKVSRQEIDRINEEFESLKIQSESSQKRQRQFFNKNMLLQRQMQANKDQVRTLKRELEKVKNDFQQTLKMCQAYQQKTTTLSKKQNLMRETVEDCKQRLDNAILQKQKAQLKQKQLEKLIESINNKNREEIEAFKNNYQKIITCQNQKIRTLEQEREDLHSSYHQTECSMKHQVEKLKKQNSMLKQQNNKHINNVRNNSGNQIISKLKDLEEKNQNLARMLSQKQRSYREQVDHKEQMVRNLQNQNRDLTRQADRQRASARDATNQKTQLKSKMSVVQKEKECLEDQLSRFKKNFDSRIQGQLQTKDARIRQLQAKVREVQNNQRQLKRRTIEMLQRNQQNQQQLIQSYQKRINQLQADNTRLTNKLAKKGQKS